MYDPTSPLIGKGAAPRRLPQPASRAQFAGDRVLDAVVWCELAPGATVTEAGIMDRFGLTRAAARAALARLGHDGWARPVARQGWRVLPVTGALVGQVLSARRIAEPALGQAVLDDATIREAARLKAMLAALSGRDDPGGPQALRQLADQIDGLVLSGIDPFTAGHLRRLWAHTARIIRHLEGADPVQPFRRPDLPALVAAVLARDGGAIVAARRALIDAQEVFVLRQLLTSEAALGPGSGSARRIPEDMAATDRRDP